MTDFSENALPFILTIDFFEVAIGSVLLQEQHGKERFFNVKGRECRVYEANYHSSEGELLALNKGCKNKFSHLLWFKKLVVVTDSKTVLHWSTMNAPG